VVIALYRKTLESSLIEVPVSHGSVRDAPAHRVRMRQPTEEVRRLTVPIRPDDKIPMVRQDTVRENPNRFTLVRLDHDAFETPQSRPPCGTCAPCQRIGSGRGTQTPRGQPRCSLDASPFPGNGRSAQILDASSFPSRRISGCRAGLGEVRGSFGLSVAQLTNDALTSRCCRCFSPALNLRRAA
jgi:hypothetical protein